MMPDGARETFKFVVATNFPPVGGLEFFEIFML